MAGRGSVKDVDVPSVRYSYLRGRGQRVTGVERLPPPLEKKCGEDALFEARADDALSARDRNAHRPVVAGGPRRRSPITLHPFPNAPPGGAAPPAAEGASGRGFVVTRRRITSAVGRAEEGVTSRRLPASFLADA